MATAMKRKGLLFILSVFLCMPVCAAYAQAIPSSRRSRDAIARVRPSLEKELAGKNMRLGDPVYIRIFKESKELEVWLKTGGAFKLFNIYGICTYGWKGLGPKTKKGDGMAPEGFYFVSPGAMNPYSNFHLSFNLGYPNAYDRNRKRTGSALMVHGDCVSIGCYAMTDARIEEIYCLADAAFRGGQRFFRVHAFPFRMTDENMKKHEKSEHFEFWKNLKEGYDFFEENGMRPPDVQVRNGRYIFE